MESTDDEVDDDGDELCFAVVVARNDNLPDPPPPALGVLQFDGVVDVQELLAGEPLLV